MKRPALTSVFAALAVACTLTACTAGGNPAKAGMPTHQDGPVALDPDLRDDLLTDAVDENDLNAETTEHGNIDE